MKRPNTAPDNIISSNISPFINSKTKLNLEFTHSPEQLDSTRDTERKVIISKNLQPKNTDNIKQENN